jgi:hypothetical protein
MLKDTAIVHVDLNDTPSIPLGDSTGVEPQDELTIIGFPGNGDISQKDDPTPTSFLTPSLNKLYVSALKQSDDGAPLIQVGGNVEDGDSGGPAIDRDGNIVGLVSFGLTPNGGTTNFLQASQSAQDEVQKLNLDTTPGNFTRAWRQAFADYASTNQGHWSKAQDEFQELQKSYPNFRAVARYETYAQKQSKGELIQPAKRNRYLLIGLPLSLLIVVAGVLVMFMFRRRYQRSQLAFHSAPYTASYPDPVDPARTSAMPYKTTPPYVGEVIEHPQQARDPGIDQPTSTWEQ